MRGARCLIFHGPDRLRPAAAAAAAAAATASVSASTIQSARGRWTPEISSVSRCGQQRALSGPAQLELMVIHVLAKRGHFEAGSGCATDSGVPMVAAMSPARQKCAERGNSMDKSGPDGCREFGSFGFKVVHTKLT